MTNTITRPGDETRTRLREPVSRVGVLARIIMAFTALTARLRRASGNSLTTVTGLVRALGWTACLVVATSFIAGYLLGWDEALVFAWSGLVVVAFAALSLLGSTAHDVTVTMPNSRVVVGDPAEGAVLASNPGRRRLPALRVEVPVGEGIVEAALPAIPPEGRREASFAVPTSRRGVITLGPARTVRADPVGLFRREVVWSGTVELFVHPRTVSVPSVSAGFVRDLEGTATRDLTASDISFHALREYVPGDEPRAIHWKSSARTGSLMVRQFEETRRSHLVIALAGARDEFADDDEFELAVSVCGSLGTRAIRDGRTTSVMTSVPATDAAKSGARRLASITPVRLLDELCRVEVADAAPALPELTRAAAESAADVSLAFLVCGSVPAASHLRSAADHFRPGVEVVVVLCEPGRELTFRRYADLAVLTIGALGDLRTGLARTAA